MAGPAEQPMPDSELSTRVYAWSYRLLQNHHDALDATQEVILRSLRHPQPQVENKLAWLRRVTTNHCIDLLRRRRPFVPSESRSGEVSAPDARASKHELQAAIINGMNRLTEQQRSVLVAKVYDHETFAEIAQSMGLAISTVKTHYVRALATMRTFLQHHKEP